MDWMRRMGREVRGELDKCLLALSEVGAMSSDTKQVVLTLGIASHPSAYVLLCWIVKKLHLRNGHCFDLQP